MENIIKLLPTNIVETLGWTLMHSLWQSLLLLVIFCIVLFFTKNNDAKYRTGLLLVFGQVIISIITFGTIYKPQQAINEVIMYQSALVNVGQTLSRPMQEIPIFMQVNFWLAAKMNIIVNIWLVGLLFYMIRFGFNFWQVNQLKTKEITKPNKEIITLFETIKSKIKLNLPITLMESSRILSPILIGHLKPIILLPIGLCSHLSIQEIEAIIAHELAHLKRHDYLFNLLQSVVDILYFFNPALLYISTQVRELRENCCDDFASTYCGDSLPIARALVNLESYRQESTLAMAFGRKRYLLKNRVQKVLGISADSAIKNNGIFIVILILVTSIFYINIEKTFAQQPPKKKIAKKAVIKSSPKYNYYHGDDNDNEIHVDNGGEQLTISQKNGTVFVNKKAYHLSPDDSLKMMYHQAEIKKLSNEINQYSKNKSHLSEQMSLHTSKIPSNSAPLNTKSMELAKLGQKIGQLAQKQASISQQMIKLDDEKDSQKIKQLEKQEKDLELEIEKIEKKMNKIELDIESIVESYEISEGPIDSLANEMEKFEAPIEALSKKIEEHSQEMYKLYPKEAVEAFERISGEKGGLYMPVPPIPPIPPIPPTPPLPTENQWIKSNQNSKKSGGNLPVPPRPPKPPKAPDRRTGYYFQNEAVAPLGALSPLEKVELVSAPLSVEMPKIAPLSPIDNELSIDLPFPTPKPVGYAPKGKFKKKK